MRRIITLFVALVAAFGSLGLSAVPAQAACPNPPFDCPFPNSLADALCVYDESNYTNLIDFWYPEELRNTCFRIEQGPQYQADSLYNNTAYAWRYFRTGDCGGSHMTINPYTSIPNLPVGWKNHVVAFSRTSTYAPC